MKREQSILSLSRPIAASGNCVLTVRAAWSLKDKNTKWSDEHRKAIIYTKPMKCGKRLPNTSESIVRFDFKLKNNFD